MNNSKRVTISKPFISWYCESVLIIDVSRKGSVQLCREIEREHNSGYGLEKVWLCNVYTAPVFRDKGVATRCINAAKDYCLRKKIKELHLCCLPGMIAFYERFGFEVTNEERLDADFRANYIMVCHIQANRKGEVEHE